MIEFEPDKKSPFLLEKINDLHRFLLQGKRAYEQVSAALCDKELSRTILSLAHESNQYAGELSSHMQTLGWVSQKEKMDEPLPEAAPSILQDENEILNFCKVYEQKMISAYREILNFSFLNDGLRKMIRYQLNGILHGFMQIKLLSSLRSG